MEFFLKGILVLFDALPSLDKLEFEQKQKLHSYL